VIPALRALLSLVLCPAIASGVQETTRGLTKEQKLASHAHMLEVLADIEKKTYEDHPALGQRKVREMRARLAAADDSTSPAELVQMHHALGLLELFQGNSEVAVEHLETAHRMVATMPKVPEGLERLTYNLGVACMRWGEDQNCLARHTAESCILPIKGGGIHKAPEGSRKAIGYFTEELEKSAPDDATSLGARWLLNLAYMTVGEYPDGVPEKYLIPPSTFASDAEFPRFVNIAPELGLNDFDLAGGSAAEDYDLDGRMDLFFTSNDTKHSARYFHNTGEGGFEDRSQAAGLEGIKGGLNFTQADHDSDGDTDVLITRGGWWLGHNGEHPVSLLENQGPDEAGRFIDVTFAAGLAKEWYPSQSADWADYDGDGDLDLYIAAESSDDNRHPCQLFQNRGDGTFVDVTVPSGTANLRFAKGVSFGDIDADGDPDLYVSNYMDANRLYENDGQGKFRDVAKERGVERPFDSFPAWFWDFDNDGALDIYCSTFYQSTDGARIAPIVASYLHMPMKSELNALYKGDGRGNFRDVALEKGLDLLTVIMGASFGDLDNDGFPDPYLGTGYPFYDGLVPNVMYWNRGGERFADVTTAGGFGHLQKGHGVTFADLDDDGDEDVIEQMGGAYPGDAFGDLMFENPGFGNHWLKVRLVGTKSNRSGVGARVRAEITENGKKRSVYKTMGQHGSFGNSPFELHLGLGQATKVDALEVFWPLTKATQTFRDVQADKRVRVTEGSDALDVQDAHPTPFQKKP